MLPRAHCLQSTWQPVLFTFDDCISHPRNSTQTLRLKVFEGDDGLALFVALSFVAVFLCACVLLVVLLVVVVGWGARVLVLRRDDDGLVFVSPSYAVISLYVYMGDVKLVR